MYRNQWKWFNSSYIKLWSKCKGTHIPETKECSSQKIPTYNIYGAGSTNNGQDTDDFPNHITTHINHMYVVTTSFTGHIQSNQTVRFIDTSSLGFNYVIIFYHEDLQAIKQHYWLYMVFLQDQPIPLLARLKTHAKIIIKLRIKTSGKIIK